MLAQVSKEVLGWWGIEDDDDDGVCDDYGVDNDDDTDGDDDDIQFEDGVCSNFKGGEVE